MRSLSQLAVIAAVVTFFILPSGAVRAADAEHWTQWRGADQNGVADGATYPVEWSAENGVVWETELPGRGGSTPIVAGGMAFLTAGTKLEENQPGNNLLVAIDLETGNQAWATKIGDDVGGKHKKGSGANPSAVSNGQSVFAYFRSGDLACVDFDGEIQWQVNLQKEFGEDTLWWDLGSSPTLINDLVVVAVMQTGPSYVVAYDQKTGQQVWKADRDLGAPEEAAQSYATPIALKEQNMIAVMGADHLTIHSAEDGRELGRVGGFNPTQHKYFRSISSPVAEGDFIVCPYARGATVTTCRISDVIAGKGRDSIVWFRDDLGSDVPTPAIHNGRVYFADDGKGSEKGLISAVDLETGKTIWSLNLPRVRGSIGYSSSPLVAGNRLYVTSESATTYVVGPLDSSEPGLVSSNQFTDDVTPTVSSMIPVEGGLIQRTRNKLYRVGN